EVAACRERVLQRREVGLAVLERADLAVKQHRPLGQLRQWLDEAAELLGPVVAVPRVDPYLGPGYCCQRPVAVILHLEEPAGAGGNLVDQRRKLRGPELRQADFARSG